MALRSNVHLNWRSNNEYAVNLPHHFHGEEKAVKSNFNKGLKKKELIDGYVQLRQAAINEVGVDMVRQTVAILLYSLRISERGYSDDQLREMYKNFVAVINFPEFMGKKLRSDEITDYITKELGIDLDEINPEIGE